MSSTWAQNSSAGFNGDGEVSWYHGLAASNRQTHQCTWLLMAGTAVANGVEKLVLGDQGFGTMAAVTDLNIEIIKWVEARDERLRDISHCYDWMRCRGPDFTTRDMAGNHQPWGRQELRWFVRMCLILDNLSAHWAHDVRAFAGENNVSILPTVTHAIKWTLYNIMRCMTNTALSGLERKNLWHVRLSFVNAVKSRNKGSKERG